MDKLRSVLRGNASEDEEEGRGLLDEVSLVKTSFYQLNRFISLSFFILCDFSGNMKVE